MDNETQLDRVLRLTRHVRTPEGVKHFHKPIGSVIGNDPTAHVSAHWGPPKAPTANGTLAPVKGPYVPPAPKALTPSKYSRANPDLRKVLLEIDEKAGKSITGLMPEAMDDQRLNQELARHQSIPTPSSALKVKEIKAEISRRLLLKQRHIAELAEGAARVKARLTSGEPLGIGDFTNIMYLLNHIESYMKLSNTKI